MRFFSEAKFEAAQIAGEVYDPEKVGGTALRGLLGQRACAALLGGVERNAGLFREAPRRYLNAEQGFSFFYAGEADEDRAEGAFEILYEFRDRYRCLCGRLGKVAGFPVEGVGNSIAVQRYPAGSVGITPHRDESRFVNLISVFVLSGEAPFGVNTARRTEDAVRLDAEAGDAVLLRAPRGPGERRIRPFHFVGRVTREWVTVVLREKRSASETG